MASTNKTPHYGLPQYIGTDKPTYLGDFNGAMLEIDTEIYSANTLAQTADTNASNAITQVGAIQESLTSLQSTVSSQGAQLATTTNLANNLNTEVNATFTTGILNFISNDPTNITVVSGANNVNYKTITIGNLTLYGLYGLVQFNVVNNDTIYLSDLNKIFTNIPVLNNTKDRRFYMIGELSFKDVNNEWHISSCSLSNLEQSNKSNFSLAPFFPQSDSTKLANGQINLIVQCCLLA